MLSFPLTSNDVYYIIPVKILAVFHSLYTLTNQASQNNIFPRGILERLPTKQSFSRRAFVEQCVITIKVHSFNAMKSYITTNKINMSQTRF